MSKLFLYIDPGAGNLLLQFIIGAVLAVSVFFKNIRYRIMHFFGGKKEDPEA